MIDVLYNKLAAANDASLAEWKDVSESIFCKHVQHSQHSQHSQHPLHHNATTKVNAVEPPVEPLHIPTPSVSNNAFTLKEKDVKQPLQTIPVSKSKKKEKDTTIKPLEIIINETTSFNNSTAYVKEALVAMISKEEFAKIFGMTKCAEMMSGIVNNRWNKSTALFISFLLDKEVYYNDNIVLYNKEKNKGRITIAKV